jgi:hypothetical protein
MLVIVAHDTDDSASSLREPMLSNISVISSCHWGADAPRRHQWNSLFEMYQAVAESIGWDGVGAPLAHLFGELTSLF